MTKSAKGAFACATVDQRALEKGAISSIPIVETRYDRIIDWQQRCYRVQIKYSDCSAAHSQNAVQVNLRTRGHTGSEKQGYSSHEVDAIAVYIAKLDVICWFTIDELAGKSAFTIRLEPAKNGQVKNCRFYHDYLW